MGGSCPHPDQSWNWLAALRTSDLWVEASLPILLFFILGGVSLYMTVLDELGFIPFTKDGAQLLFQVCSDLYERVSIIVTTNLRFGDWNSIFGESNTARYPTL